MSRLTNSKSEKIARYNDAYDSFLRKCYCKLRKHEDIEDRLGIEFSTLFDMLENGFWFKGKNGGLFHAYGMLDLRRLAMIVDEDDGDFSEFPLSEYGKTWAHTKEVLK